MLTWSGSSDGIAPFLASNRAWASQTQQNDPNYFSNLSKGQQPQILWLGCSDSRVPETTILGLKPGDVFVHRNIANIITATDLSSFSVIEFAVNVLKVKHVILCGHSTCGGVLGALSNESIGKIDMWLQPLRQLRYRHAEELAQLDEAGKTSKLVELNVKQGVETLRQNQVIIDATKTWGLQVHGLVFDLASGELKSVDTDEPSSTTDTRNAAFGYTKGS